MDANSEKVLPPVIRKYRSMLRKAYIICAVAAVRITNRSATGRIRKTALKEIRPPAMTHTMKCLSSTKGR